MPLGGVRVLKGVHEAGAVHRLLLDAVDELWLGQANGLEDGRADVDAVGELRAQVSFGLDALRPGDDHRVARPAQVARHLLAPLEGRVVGMGPGRGEVRRSVIAPPALDAAVLLDQLQLLLGVELDAVEEGHLVERAGERPFHAGAVVAPDVQDERVVEVTHLLDRVEQAADVPVGVLGEAREDLHLARVQLLLGVVERVPGRKQLRPLSEYRVLRDDPELLLTLERLLAVRVPAAVELALVPVGPLPGHVVRRVAAAGGVVHEPWLLRVLRAHGVQPLDGLVGEVVREVVRRAVLALGYAERRVVLRDDRVVLARSTAQEAPPVVEAPRLRPVVERTSRSRDVARREVPLTEPAGDVTVLLQDAGKGGAAPGPRGRVPGERARELSDRAKAYPVVVAAGQQPRTGRRAHGRDVEAVVRQPHLLHPRQVRGVDRAAEGAGGTETGVVDQDDQHVRCVLGRLRPGDDRPVGHRLVHCAPDRPAEGPIGDRQDRTVGAELAGSFCQGVLELLQAIFVHLGNRLRGRVGERLFGNQPIIAHDDGDDGRRTRFELITETFLEAAIELVLGELADQATCCRTHNDRSEQRW